MSDKTVKFVRDVTFEGMHYDAGTEIDLDENDLHLLNPAVIENSDEYNEFMKTQQTQRRVKAVRTQKSYPQFAQGMPSAILHGEGLVPVEVTGSGVELTDLGPEDHGKQSQENPAAVDPNDPKMVKAVQEGKPLVQESKPGKPTGNK